MRKSRSVLFCLPITLIFLFSLSCFGQVATGTPPLGSFSGGPDVINLANLNSHLSVPVLNRAGRGVPFNYNLTYDSSIWYPVTSGTTTTWQPINYWGWGVQTAAATGYVNYNLQSTLCLTNHTVTGTKAVFSKWSYTDQFGVNHAFIGTSEFETGTCGSTMTGMDALATDGSGYTLTSTSGGAHITVTSRSGKIVNPPFLSAAGAGTSTDSNGNQISVNTTGVFTDTLGNTALTVSQNAPGPTTPTTFTYTPPSGTNVAYTMKYTNYTVQTDFGCTGIGEYLSSTPQSLVSEIDLPDGTKYLFTYEPTPGTPANVTGRLASVTLPAGGEITYAYSGGSNGIVCADGSTATLTRKTPDTGSNSWTYAHSESGTAWITTVTDPQSNKTVLNFQGIYETERQVNQGASTPLKTVTTCYNGNVSSCNSTAITLPISQKTVFHQWPGGLESRTDAFYNTYGLVTEKDEYAYGSGAPGALARKTLTTYATLSNGIFNRPSTVTVQDGSGNVKAKTTYCYDEGTPSGTATCAAAGSPTATSGTPQHVAVTGSRGNLTTIASVVSTSTTLGKTYTYYDTGNVLTATDVNGAAMTYTYGSGSCGNSFATSVSEPLSLSKSTTWNCAGGVQASVVDENGKTTSTSYTDPDFWRPNSLTDAASNVLNFTYDAATSVEAAVDFNSGNSTTDALKTVDGLGRTHVSQQKESPTSTTYDSVETDYDSLGRMSRTTLPYPAAAGVTSSSAPSKQTTYDALGRNLQVTDSGGRSVAYTYAGNDTYRTLGPAPTGENTKRKQFEYDALGRLTSVCEVTSATGSGTCAQTSTATGYWTQYSYDANNQLTGVTQNAQSSGSKQTRTYAYDDLGRLTSETNPESNNTAYAYTYDSDSTCGTSKGDLVKKIDAVGNTICYAYDALHRMTSTTYTGPYSSSTPSRYFVYDAATVNSVAMVNTKTRMAEAYTCVSPCSTKITDLGFSYTVLGQVSDAYESTTHSGGYYHVANTYFANGEVNQLSSLVGLPTITYGVDGEGRVYSASASSGQNPLTSTTYNTASLPTQINLGSSDNDAFTYDPNTNRPTQYKFNVNSQSVAGTLTWNAIGTLETLAITDPFYGAGNQTCAYTHDDESRIASANCGSPWNQTFAYDAFGNLSKSGTVSFAPTYSYLTNRMTQIGSSTPTYDANGSVLNDTAHTYTWDANGRPVTIDSVGLTYDALGRMAEQNKSGVFTELMYGTGAGKLAIMSGQTLQKAFVRLSGGSVAVYNSSGLAYYRHPDWLGSSRFASTPARGLYFDGAYAPFGENYAQTGTADLSFTGMNQDTVSNLFDFPAREYNGIHGRWPSPDPAGLSAARVPDPQTLNRYAYVRNNPLGATDPTGLMCPEGGDCGEDGDDGGDAGGGGVGGAGGVDGISSDGGGAAPPPPPPPPDPDGPGSLFGQASSGLFDWTQGGVANDPGPLQAPRFGSEFDSLADACSGECRYNSIINTGYDPAGDDPCAFSNGPGTQPTINTSITDPGACRNAGGVWLPPGQAYTVNPDGSVSVPSLNCHNLGVGTAWFTAAGAASAYGAAVSTGTIVGAPAAPVFSALSILAFGLAAVTGLVYAYNCQ